MASTPLRAIRIPNDVWERAQEMAAVNGETLTAVVLRALTEYATKP